MVRMMMEAGSDQLLSARNSVAAVVGILGCWLGYRVLLIFYNLSPFHPLARFPGPKIAAASYLYEAYYDWWLVGRYGHEIRRMHEKYGECPCLKVKTEVSTRG
jgi:hypothetical protein